jgi:hypothetical protein
MWVKCENFKNIIASLKDLINSNLQKFDTNKKTTTKNVNEKNINNASANEKHLLKENFVEIVKFLNTLFNNDYDKKFEIEIYGVKYNQKTLWDFIISKVFEKYKYIF